MRVDVILLSPTALFRRKDGGMLETGTTNGGGGALEGDYIEDNNNVSGG